MLKNRLKEDQITALKSSDQKHLSILRYILSQIQRIEVDTRNALTDGEIIAVLKKISKEIQESLAAAKKSERPELVKKSEGELEIVNSYLPPELSDEELRREIKKLISQNEELHTSNPKALIGLCIKALKSKADPTRIIKILEEI